MSMTYLKSYFILKRELVGSECTYVWDVHTAELVRKYIIMINIH